MVTVGGQTRIDDMAHARPFRGVDGGAVPGDDGVVLAVARGDHQQHFHVLETLGEGVGIVEVDASHGQPGLGPPEFATSEYDVVTVGQLPGDKRAQGARGTSDQNHQGLPVRVGSLR